MRCLEIGPGDDEKLASEAISLVQQTWAIVRSGGLLFVELLQQNLQKSGSTLIPIQSLDRAAHQAVVVSLTDSIVQGLPNIKLMAYFSHKLRQLYVGAKNIQQFATDIGVALLLTIEQILNGAFSPDARRAWVGACDIFRKSLLAYASPALRVR